MIGFRFSLAPLFALTVFTASAGIVWLAHVEAGKVITQRQPPLVKASTAPLKRSPEDPGGSAVADLGGVGDLLRERPADTPAGSEERLLPTPEQPVTPSDTAEGRARDEANAAFEALIAARRGDREVGIGGPNPDESVNFPSPSRPGGTADQPVTSEPVTPLSVSPGQNSPSSANENTSVAAVTPEQPPAFEATTGGRFRVQLAAVREEEDAKRAWELFQASLGPFISGLQPFFERAETSNGTFYRVQVGPFAETAEADRLCVELKKQDASCFVVSR